MAIEEIRKMKKSEMESFSLESSLTMGDSDSESTSASSSMQSSISSATSSLDQHSSNVKEGSLEKRTLKKSISKKFANFGSFISSRRRSQSRLSQSSIKLSDDGSATPPHSSIVDSHSSSIDAHSSSIEASDESTNYVQKPIPKFSRTGSLRSVKILRSKSKNKNKSGFKSKKSSTKQNPEILEDSHFESATFSSTLKDSKFPEQLKHQPGPLEPEEILPVAKVCPYQHCSLHGHHHHNHDPPQKRFAYLKRRTTKDPKIVTHESQPMDKSSGKKRETKETKKVSNDVDPSIEFYAKTRSEPLSSYGHDDAEFADILFGVNSLQEKKNETPVSNHQDIIDLNDKNDDNSNGSKSVLKKKSSLKKTNNISMWHMIHQHMVSGLEAESADTILQLEQEQKKSNTKDFDDAASQETEIRKMFAIKLVRDAIEKILLPEVQDDQSATSEVASEQDLSEKSQNGGEITSDRKEKPSTAVEKVETETEKRAPNRWSYLKKVILLTKFVKELEKVKKFNPKKVIIPSAFEQEPETVALRRQTTGDKKNSDEWMLDYALQKVVGELAPTQKRKVALLVKAFETVAPTQEDQQESRSNGELQRVNSEMKGKVEEISEPEIKSTTNVSPSLFSEKDKESKKSTTNVSPSLFSEKDKESKPDLEKEKHIKMWHMIYQHVATDIVTKIGSDLLLDGEESMSGEEKNLQEVEDRSERDFRIAIKLVRDSVDEILLPDFPDNSSQDTQSVASDTASEQDFVIDENKKPTVEEPLSTGNRFQQQRSKNWTKLKKLILLKRSIKALEGFRNLKPQIPQQEILKSGQEGEKVDLRRQMMDERKKAEQWMLDYAVQHIVTKLTPARKKRVSMLVEAFEAVVPFPEI